MARQRTGNSNIKSGPVYLIGAGPGDPGLITLKGLQCIEKADVVVYDRLVSPRLLQHARDGAELIYVGKEPDRHTLKQEEINALLAEKAGAGLQVARLKGGDPFVFGRGGEEAAYLAERGLAFEVVPGITSAVAVPAYAGIPVTHRGLAAGFTVITGHEDPAKEGSDLNWAALAGGTGTNVILMGMGNLGRITARLVEEGLAPSTPAALIQEGTRAGQKTLTGTLEDIARRAEEESFGPPAVIVTGPVVELRRTLRWLEVKPLFGRRIVVSRARAQASAFAEKLEELGAETIQFPAIRIEPPEDYGPLDRALENLGSYSWVIFTSENGVKHFFRRLREKGLDIRELKGARICAIGPKTGEALAEKGLKVAYMPDQYRAEAVVEQIGGEVKAGHRVLLPRADLARPVLAEALQALGAAVDNVACYRTTLGEGDAGLLKELLEAGAVDMITFTSSSTVNNICSMLGPGASGLLKGVALAAIGPITAATARDQGLEVAVEAEEYTTGGLIKAIEKYFSRQKEQENEPGLPRGRAGK